jgi:hypothetical protein
MRDVQPSTDNSSLTKASDSKVKNVKAIQQGSSFDASSEKALSPDLSKLIEKDPRWAEGIKSMKDHGNGNEKTWDVMDTFSDPPEADITNDEIKCQRWYGGEANKIGIWVTTDKYKTGEEAKRYLNLPDANKANKPPADLIIEKGTPRLIGKSKGDGVHPGGGNQILVLDKTKIHEA